MLSDQQRQDAAQAVFKAERECVAIPQLSKTYPDIELHDAYEIQRLWAELHEAEGARHRAGQHRPRDGQHGGALRGEGRGVSD